MADRARAPLPLGAQVAAIASGAMIAQQVAGKAARDAFYLSRFDVQTLPAMMAASAVISLVAMLWVSRLMVRHSPARVVPVAFAVSGAAFLAEWALSFPAPRLAAVALYVHTAIFGAVIISAFWSLINETFAPHSGRNAVSWVAGGGTLGGVLGGLAAWRAAGWITVPTMLPLLAVVNLVCLWGVLRLGRARPLEAVLPSAEATPGFAPLRVLRDVPLLRNLALIVGLGAVTSGLLDYVFSAEAVKHFRKGPELLAFFSLFWLAVGVLSFLVQMAFARRALDKLGLAVTVALLPLVVVLAGAFGLFFPGLSSMALVRGGEATQRNSLFRAAYELLYTPLAEQTKRSAKTLIDVGFDRLGTVMASAIAIAVVAFARGRAEGIILGVAVGCALLSLARTRALHRGYVAMLEDSLRTVAAVLEPATARPSVQIRIAVRDEVVAHVDALEAEDPLAFAPAAADAGAGEAAPSLAEAAVPSPDDPSPSGFVPAVRDLTSGDARRVRKILGAEAPLPAPLVPFAILLLAHEELHVDAIVALRKAAPRATGSLADALCDPRLAFDIRRRIPRALSECRTQQAAEGLVRGLDDERFEVRYACGRALLKLRSEPAIVIPPDQVIAIVTREVLRAKGSWEAQPLDDDEDAEETCLVDRLLRDRIDRSMEHVFNVLALHLDPGSLRTAFNALHTDDARLHGTALEYLDAVLPEAVRELVWPFLGETRPMRAERPAGDILADIARFRTAPAPGE